MAYKQLKLWFDKDLAIRLGNEIHQFDSSFNTSAFVQRVCSNLASLELKDRVRQIARCLHDQFNNDYKIGINVLSKILGPENPKEVDMFKEYYWIMPIAKYVEDYGLDDFDLSMKAIEEITKRNTGEYAVRPFIRKYPERTLSIMSKWSENDNKHIRRLSSEGGRPRLPWATKLDVFIEDPKPLLPILENLKNDQSKYIQNSVANCINDIFKDNRDIATELIESWLPSITAERKWIVKHAIRNDRKKNDPWALSVMNRING